MHCIRSHNLKARYDGLRAATVTSLLSAILIAQVAFGANPFFVDAQVVEFDIIRSNPEAAAEASAAVREFLAKHL
jgi:hypothetical protein